ncbi:WD40-repeat-containing domain protein [Mycena pura]|uniref:WD40-repeat-containing domain protein n=1 Tax=Mycena pura TaxID=153505 RepID=A0AAD6Y045_9AGAR|nr:WD40-repeat-containing domain protein [Mycena pura]
MPYKLSATLAGLRCTFLLAASALHCELIVHALGTPADDLILSVSRESTAIVWRRAAAAATFTQDSVFRARAIVTRISPDYTLLGHTNNVRGLRTTPEGHIISCSWDYMWKNFSLAYELKGHENSVWDVLAANEEEFITGSADETIKLWKQHKTMCTFTLVSFVPYSAYPRHRICIMHRHVSFPLAISVYSFDDDPVYTLTGHTSFIYRLAVLLSGDLVSSSEDRSRP